MKARPTIALLALLAAGVPAPTARAADCTYSVPDLGTSGDTFYGGLWNCRQDVIDYLWYGYDFYKLYWEDGWGYDDPCNITKPLGREFSAMTAIMWSNDPPPSDRWDYSGPILKWGMSYSMEKVNGTRTFCGDGSSVGSFAYPILDLYLGNFYGQTVVERASTVIHESRHSERIHNGSGWVNDSDWDYHGAWMYEALWLWWFRAAAVRTTTAQKEFAKDIGNGIMASRFDNPPPFVIP
jgi:hypothetical protein